MKNYHLISSSYCNFMLINSPFSLMMSIRMSITINVPVLPIPALRRTAESEKMFLCITAAGVSVIWRCIPAVYCYWPGIQNALLLQVDLLQEVQNTPWISGDPVIWPGFEVVLPHCAFRVALIKRHRAFQAKKKNFCVRYIQWNYAYKSLCSFWSTLAQPWLGTEQITDLTNFRQLQFSEGVVVGGRLSDVANTHGAILLQSRHLRPVLHTLTLLRHLHPLPSGYKQTN